MRYHIDQVHVTRVVEISLSDMEEIPGQKGVGRFLPKTAKITFIDGRLEEIRVNGCSQRAQGGEARMGHTRSIDRDELDDLRAKGGAPTWLADLEDELLHQFIEGHRSHPAPARSSPTQ